MNQLLEWTQLYKIQKEYARLLSLFMTVIMFVGWGVFCLHHGFANQAMGYFLSPFMAGMLIFLRRAWLPTGAIRVYDELVQMVAPPFLLDRATIRYMILAALTFLSLVFHVLARYLTSILSYFRYRLVEESIHHQHLLVLDLSPRSPPVSL